MSNSAADNVNRLTLAFAKAVANQQEDKSDNLIVSPYNALSALSMVAMGADNETRAEMQKAFYNNDSESLAALVGDFMKLNSDVMAANKGQVELSSANGIWANKQHTELNGQFAQDMRDLFAAEISAETFDEALVDKINQWASDNTNGLIKEVLKQLKPKDAVVLASALYFKGEWTSKFDKALTEDKSFSTDSEGTAVTPMMYQDFKKEGAISYQKGAGYEAVSMTYGQKDRANGKQPTMRIVLVRPTDSGISARDWLTAQDTSATTPAWLDQYSFSGVIGSVELPRIDIQQKHDLIPALKEMGVKSVFNVETADLSKMAKGDLFVSKVSHDVVFKTDEVGSEAAAVTVAVVTRECMMMPPEKIDFKVDRSFVFAVQDIKTGAVMFIGAINKPNQDMKPYGAKLRERIVNPDQSGKDETSNRKARERIINPDKPK